MTSAPDFETCFSVTEAHIQAALAPSHSIDEPSPRERVLALLDRMAAVAKPRQGAPKMLIVLARMAGADWIDGRLEVRVKPDGAGVVLEVLVDDGLSVTRVRPPLRVGAPYEELVKAVDLHAAMVAPLVPTAYSDAGFVLSSEQENGPASSGTMDAVVGEVLGVRARRPSVRPAAERDAAPKSARPAPKSMKPPAKSVRPGPKSMRPAPKSLRPGPKSVPAPKSVKPPARPFVPKPPPPIVPRAPAPVHVANAPRRPAPSDVTATVRKTVDPSMARPPSPARAPGANIKATVKVDAVNIPREALREPRKPMPPPPANAIKDSRHGGKPVSRDEEE